MDKHDKDREDLETIMLDADMPRGVYVEHNDAQVKFRIDFCSPETTTHITASYGVIMEVERAFDLIEITTLAGQVRAVVKSEAAKGHVICRHHIQ